jgi:hypothetical protein
VSEDRAKRIALLLQAIEDLHAEKAEFLTEWKSRMTVLENQLGTLRTEILTGQLTLVPDPEPPKEAA